jgi:hypothetical protein
VVQGDGGPPQPRPCLRPSPRSAPAPGQGRWRRAQVMEKGSATPGPVEPPGLLQGHHAPEGPVSGISGARRHGGLCELKKRQPGSAGAARNRSRAPEGVARARDRPDPGLRGAALGLPLMLRGTTNSTGRRFQGCNRNVAGR